MKTLLCVLLLFSIFAQADDNSFGESDTIHKPIPIDHLRYQFGLRGEVLVFNKTGTRLLHKENEERRWQFGSDKPIVNNWRYRSKNIPEIDLQHEWQVNAEGQLEVKVRQYDSMERIDNNEVKLGKLLKEKEFKIENMDSVSWVASEDDNKRVVVRFTVDVWGDDKGIDIGKLGINSGRMTVFDGKGSLWASKVDNSEGNNIYFAMTTHMGSVYLSYVPFKGAKKIGVAEKDRMRLDDGQTKLYIESADNFLPRGITANVYGYFDFNRRTGRYNSVRSSGSSTEENFLKQIK